LTTNTSNSFPTASDRTNTTSDTNNSNNSNYEKSVVADVAGENDDRERDLEREIERTRDEELRADFGHLHLAMGRVKPQRAKRPATAVSKTRTLKRSKAPTVASISPRSGSAQPLPAQTASAVKLGTLPIAATSTRPARAASASRHRPSNKTYRHLPTTREKPAQFYPLSTSSAPIATLAAAFDHTPIPITTMAPPSAHALTPASVPTFTPTPVPALDPTLTSPHASPPIVPLPPAHSSASALPLAPAALRPPLALVDRLYMPDTWASPAWQRQEYGVGTPSADLGLRIGLDTSAPGSQYTGALEIRLRRDGEYFSESFDSTDIDGDTTGDEMSHIYPDGAQTASASQFRAHVESTLAQFGPLLTTEMGQGGGGWSQASSRPGSAASTVW
jgi:hypothetical protein